MSTEGNEGNEIKDQSKVKAEDTSASETTLTTTDGTTLNERTWAALAHASVLLTFALGVSTGGLSVLVTALIPLVIWLAFRDRSSYVAFHAMQATVFQLGSLLAWIGVLAAGIVILIPLWILTILLMFILIGFLLLPVTLVLTILFPAILVALPFVSLVYGLYGAYEVYSGREFRYWLVAGWIEERGLALVNRGSPA